MATDNVTLCWLLVQKSDSCSVEHKLSSEWLWGVLASKCFHCSNQSVSFYKDHRPWNDARLVLGDSEV